LTTVTVSFKGAQEKILEEMVGLGMVKTKTEAIRVALLNFALTSGLMSKEKILGEIHKQAKSIRVNEADLQRMVERAKEGSIHR